jgi:hypothetical protein
MKAIQIPEDQPRKSQQLLPAEDQDVLPGKILHIAHSVARDDQCLHLSLPDFQTTDHPLPDLCNQSAFEIRD